MTLKSLGSKKRANLLSYHFLPTRKIVGKKWFGPLLIMIATGVYFVPIIIRLGTYIPGGDAMFNAWVMDRNQHCILNQNCPDYRNANIYYPNNNTMLYSETEISPSIVTIPIHLINPNPIYAYNIITITSFFMLGFSMYLLVSYLTKGNRFISVYAGLLFEFSPVMIAAVHNLQSLSIFCLPLAILQIIKFNKTKDRKNLVWLFFILVYVFYASWYQMFYVLLSIGTIISLAALLRLAKLKTLIIVSSVVLLATISTLPLAIQYINFSKQGKAVYTLQEKMANSASLLDYVVPTDNSAFGKIINNNHPYAVTTQSYAGYSLVILFIISIVIGLKNKVLTRDIKKITLILIAIAAIGFLNSLGPLLKINHSYQYMLSGLNVSIPLPFIFIHKYVPQLGFLRGLARANILLMFALTTSLAVFWYVTRNWSLQHGKKLLINFAVGFILAFDLFPLHMYQLDTNPHSINTGIPPLYVYIKDHPEIDNLIMLQAEDYPKVNFWFARTENVLWSGYHNRNIYNGYSGYTPPNYDSQYSDFVNLDPSDPAKMRSIGLKYVIVDYELYTNKPEVTRVIKQILGPSPVYKDTRYSMYKL